jgi:precorrin-6B C5,15-methyltransferase / cobalt-precorrin-6B C5,C15-methyltransferase
MITVVGLGEHPLGHRAVEALGAATLVAGGRRHLDAVAPLLSPKRREVELRGDLAPALAALAADPGPGVVLASGDPGFFGIVRVLAERFSPGALRIVPAVSTVASAFARIGLSWDDAVVTSAGGRDPAVAVNLCRRYPKVAVLTSPAFGPAALAAVLRHLDRTLVVVEQVGAAAERVTTGAPAAISSKRFSDPNIVLCFDPEAALAGKATQWPPRLSPQRWALPEDAFDHRDGMITKAEIRALALAWLGPGPGDLVWDLGAGSGSVTVEAARLGAAVIAVDADPAQCRRIRANAQRHGVPAEVVEGQAPAVLTSLPDPDAVFVGGGGALLGTIVRTAADRAPRVVVVALATVERVGEVRQILTKAGLAVEGVQLAAARLTPVGQRGGTPPMTASTTTRLAAANPVFLLSGRRDA